MGEVIPMDSLSRGAKPEENGAGNPGQGAPGGTGGKLDNFVNKLNNPASGMPEKHQKALQKTLGQLQKAAPAIQKMASGGILGKIGLIKSVLKQIDFGRDWIFILVASFALLKDIFDVALAGVPGVGVVVSWIMAIMLLLLTVVALLLTGSDLKNRGMAKYILTMAVGFIAESLPGIDWLPLAFIETLLVYALTLFDRGMKSSDQENEGKESGSAEAEPERKAA
ncbi:hypothetical protein D4R51_01825 [bacterium]|nr:MAG: hypothetical protein D4R51_01825 [bacterium]